MYLSGRIKYVENMKPVSMAQLGETGTPSCRK